MEMVAGFLASNGHPSARVVEPLFFTRGIAINQNWGTDLFTPQVFELLTGSIKKVEATTGGPVNPQISQEGLLPQCLDTTKGQATEDQVTKATTLAACYV